MKRKARLTHPNDFDAYVRRFRDMTPEQLEYQAQCSGPQEGERLRRIHAAVERGETPPELRRMFELYGAMMRGELGEPEARPPRLERRQPSPRRAPTVELGEVIGFETRPAADLAEALEALLDDNMPEEFNATALGRAVSEVPLFDETTRPALEKVVMEFSTSRKTTSRPPRGTG